MVKAGLPVGQPVDIICVLLSHCCVSKKETFHPRKQHRTTMGTAVYVLVVNKTILVAASSATNIDAKPYVAFHYCTTTLQCIPRCYQLAVTSRAVEDTSSARIFSGGPCQLTQLRGAILGPYCWESTSFVISFSSLMFTV